MQSINTIEGMRAVVLNWRNEGATVGIVPTMGGLHEGHMSLVRLARKHVDYVIATLFVNPAQFSQDEDFDSYPRNENADRMLFEQAGVHLVFAPPLHEIYPSGYSTRVSVEGLSDSLEGECRPDFFTGVATVVSKFLIQAMADVAVFGEKDYQQLQIIRRMVRDLDIPTQIISAPTIREEDGLAMSSRNFYLNESERACAGKLYKAISEVANSVRQGRQIDSVCAEAIDFLKQGGFKTVDYFTVRDAETLGSYKGVGRPGRVLAAAWLGKARLIDNIAV